MKILSMDENFIELNEKLRNQLSSLTAENSSSFEDIAHCTRAIHFLRKAGNAKYPEENYHLVTNLLIKINKNENINFINFAEVIGLLISILNLRELPEIAI